MNRRQPTELDFRPFSEVSLVEQESAMRLVARHCPDDEVVMAMLFAPLGPAMGRGTLNARAS